MPLPAVDVEAFRAAEMKLRSDRRDKAGLAKLGPGALELATTMDRTVSFLLLESQSKLKAEGAGSGGRLAAPAIGLPPPGAASFGSYFMTSWAFNELVSQLGETSAHAGSLTADNPVTTDTVTIGGNTGKITTLVTVSASKGASKVTVIVRTKVSGEVRDGTGAILFKIESEATGAASGDACPDTSGAAHAKFTFRGREDYFDATGATTTGSNENYESDFTFKADDSAKLASVDFTSTGDVGNDLMMRFAATTAAPSFETAWRSGICIDVQVDPESTDVERDSVTTVDVKLRHKIEGNDLDLTVQASFSGAKSLDPVGKKQRSPATFQYTAGPKDDDEGTMNFESVSNRGIGRTFVRYVVGGGTWTITSTGTSKELAAGVATATLRVVANLEMKIKEDRTLAGTGTMTLSGPVSAVIASYMSCSGDVDYTVKFTATGRRIGTGTEAVLRLTLRGENGAEGTLVMNCTASGYTLPQSSQPAPFSVNWAFALGQIDLPSSGGTKSISRSA
ncbi:MAG: hypothetical protein ABI785_14485, partial [Gemmatimonadales bacterium]